MRTHLRLAPAPSDGALGEIALVTPQLRTRPAPRSDYLSRCVLARRARRRHRVPRAGLLRRPPGMGLRCEPWECRSCGAANDRAPCSMSNTNRAPRERRNADACDSASNLRFCATSGTGKNGVATWHYDTCGPPCRRLIASRGRNRVGRCRVARSCRSQRQESVQAERIVPPQRDPHCRGKSGRLRIARDSACLRGWRTMEPVGRDAQRYRPLAVPVQPLI